ncbi:unnamed protein product, partial [marine sediment metagenome]
NLNSGSGRPTVCSFLLLDMNSSHHFSIFKLK